MLYEVAQRAARLDHVARPLEHVEVALVVHHEAPRGVEQQKPLSHVVDGGGKALFLEPQLAARRLVLTCQLADDQGERDCDDQRAHGAEADQEAGLLTPFRERRFDRSGRGDDDRKRWNMSHRDNALDLVDRANHLEGIMLGRRRRLIVDCDLAADHGVDARNSRHQRAVGMQDGNRRVLVGFDRIKESLDALWRNAPCHHTEKLAGRRRNPATNDNGPVADKSVTQQRHALLHRRVGPHRLEVLTIGDVHLANRPFG